MGNFYREFTICFCSRPQSQKLEKLCYFLPPIFSPPAFGGWKRVDGLVAGGCPAIDPVDVIDSDEDDDDIVFTPPGCKRSWHSALRAASVKVHPNVYCDGCNKNIDGHRYKCMECDDFDLCHACESQLKHKEHVMLRIPLTMSHYTKVNFNFHC